MADRIVVLSANPGRIRTVVDNRLARPRHYRSPEMRRLVDTAAPYRAKCTIGSRQPCIDARSFGFGHTASRRLWPIGECSTHSGPGGEVHRLDETNRFSHGATALLKAFFGACLSPGRARR